MGLGDKNIRRLELNTQRLKLIPLSCLQLQLYLEHPLKLEQRLEVAVSRTILTTQVQRAIRTKLTKMRCVEEILHPWYTYWLVVVSTEPFGAGLVGFKSFPNDQGDVEIGYGIDPAYQRQGYTTEAVRTLVAWAFKEPACRFVIAQVTKHNLASQRVLSNVGMTIYQEAQDVLNFRLGASQLHV